MEPMNYCSTPGRRRWVSSRASSTVWGAARSAATRGSHPRTADEGRSPNRLRAAQVECRGRRCAGTRAVPASLFALDAACSGGWRFRTHRRPTGLDCGSWRLVEVLALPDDPLFAARELYGLLRSADAGEASLLLVEVQGDSGMGRAVNDRLFRASHGRVARDCAPGTVSELARLSEPAQQSVEPPTQSRWNARGSLGK